MKIIAVDNFDRESVSDVLIIPYVINPEIAEQIADLLNKDGAGSDKFYKAVDNDHKLYKFEP